MSESSKALPAERLFSANEQALINQAEVLASNHIDNPDSSEMIRLRLRNLIEKYRELSKREYFQSDTKDNLSKLSTQISGRKVQYLQQLLDQINRNESSGSI